MVIILIFEEIIIITKGIIERLLETGNMLLIKLQIMDSKEAMAITLIKLQKKLDSLTNKSQQNVLTIILLDNRAQEKKDMKEILIIPLISI